MNKKILLTLSAPILALSPVVAVVACGKKETSKTQSLTETQLKALLENEVNGSISTITEADFIKNTEWQVGSSKIASAFGISIPSTNLNIRAKYVADNNTNSDTTSVFKELKIEYQISKNAFPTTGNPTEGTFTKGETTIKVASNLDGIAFGKELTRIVKHFGNGYTRKSSLDKAALKALSEEDQKSLIKLGTGLSMTSGFTLEITAFDLTETDSEIKTGAVVEIEATLKKGDISEPMVLKFVSSDFTFDTEGMLTSISAGLNVMLGNIEVETLPEFTADQTLNLNDLITVDGKYETISDTIFMINTIANLGFKIVSITVTEVSETEITVEIVLGNSVDANTTEVTSKIATKTDDETDEEENQTPDDETDEEENQTPDDETDEEENQTPDDETDEEENQTPDDETDEEENQTPDDETDEEENQTPDDESGDEDDQTPDDESGDEDDQTPSGDPE